MLINYYNAIHTSTPLHSWDIPALVIAVVLVVMILVHVRNQKKREKDFEKQREEKLEGLQKELTGGAS